MSSIIITLIVIGTYVQPEQLLKNEKNWLGGQKTVKNDDKHIFFDFCEKQKRVRGKCIVHLDITKTRVIFEKFVLFVCFGPIVKLDVKTSTSTYQEFFFGFRQLF